MREILEGCEQENGKVTKNIMRDDVNIPNNAQYTKRFGSLSLAKLRSNLIQNTIIHLTDEQLEELEDEMIREIQRCKDESDKENIEDEHVSSTVTTDFTTRMRDRWYPEGEKKFPDDLEISPLSTKIWYACDGSLVQNEHCVIYSYNERDRPKFMESLFNSTPLNPSFSLTGGGGLQFTRFESREFLDWLGESVPRYEYKWNINE